MKRTEVRSQRSAVRWAIASAPVVALVVAAGCIGNRPANPAATQPVTIVDLATTQPSYYLNMPAVASVDSLYFQPLWDACEKVSRNYGFELDRADYRSGLLTTKPAISKEFLEPWRKDAGTAKAVLDDSMATIRRTIHFEFTNDGGTYRVTPKVLVERESVVERRSTSTAQYREFFAGPAVSETNLAVTSEDVFLPKIYWTPIGRDTALERKVAAAVEKRLK